MNTGIRLIFIGAGLCLLGALLGDLAPVPQFAETCAYIGVLMVIFGILGL
jgi:hypothetical protein